MRGDRPASDSLCSQPLNRTIFLDDLPHNIKDAERLGCTGVRVPNGLTQADLRCGLRRLGEVGRGSALMSSWLGVGSVRSGDVAEAPAPAALAPADEPKTATTVDPASDSTSIRPKAVQ